jgi:putative DNA primase/helicase
MQRKTPHERCDRLRDLKVDDLKSQCARFVTDHHREIAAARPPLPETLGDRAADIWEPLFALADLAGEAWGGASRNAALSLAAAAHDSNPIAALLTDICFEFFKTDEQQQKRIFSRDLVAALNLIPNRPWAELLRGKPMTDLWLSDRLRPYGIRPRNITINSIQAKGYLYSDCEDVFRRYLTRADLTQRTGIPEDPATNGDTPSDTNNDDPKPPPT